MLLGKASGRSPGCTPVQAVSPIVLESPAGQGRVVGALLPLRPPLPGRTGVTAFFSRHSARWNHAIDQRAIIQWNLLEKTVPNRPPRHRPPRIECTSHNARPRSSPSKRGYGRRWRRLARMYRRDHPMCADPFGVHAAEGVPALGEHVDHIVPRSAGGTDDGSNLQTLCARCHSRKTALCDGVFGNLRRPPRTPPEGGSFSVRARSGYHAASVTFFFRVLLWGGRGSKPPWGA